MEKLGLQEIISAVHGSYGYPADVEISDISTDTRTIKPGSLFIALKGENFDGHNFAAKAMELGAEAVVTERPVEGARCMIVDSTARAFDPEALEMCYGAWCGGCCHGKTCGGCKMYDS